MYIPNSQKHGRIDSKTVPRARSPLTTPLPRRFAPHACTWVGLLPQGAMSSQNPQTRFNKWVKYPPTQSISRSFNTENAKSSWLEVSVENTPPAPPTFNSWAPARHRQIAEGLDHLTNLDLTQLADLSQFGRPVPWKAEAFKVVVFLFLFYDFFVRYCF